jgi:oligosaccharide repeat unit polymerase
MIYIPFIYFLLLSFLHNRRNKQLNIGSFLLGLYTLSSFFSIILFKSTYFNYHLSEIKLSSVLYYCALLTLFFLPFLSRKHVIAPIIRKPNSALFMLISFFFIIINIVAIIFSSKYTVFILTHNPGAFKIGGSILLNKLGYNIDIFEKIGFYIFGHFSDFYILILFFFFYSITYMHNGRSFNIILLFSSMATILNGLNTGGRTQMIYWILSFVAYFIYFKDCMPSNEKRFVFKMFLILASVFSIYFIGVTVYRFSNNYAPEIGHQGILSIIDYGGQSFLNFNDFFIKLGNHHYTIGRIFPIIHDLFSSTKFNLNEYRLTSTMNIGVFSTFLGDLYIDIGIVGTIIYLIVYLFMFYVTQKNYVKGSKQFHQILILFTFFQIPLNGLFFYSIWNKAATISIIGTIGIYFLFKEAKRKQNG